ncbi:MAG: hypothetical protein CR994_01570 [Maribacter sp.]|nr:MAG: hypothetical protein CR994_01570 [Maribacter sp.]
MKATKILSHLSDLESLLKDFSYEELSISEGSDIKRKFESFKTSLEDRIFTPSMNLENLDSKEERIMVKNKVSKQNNISTAKLIATVSKGMKGPLNSIIGLSDLLKEGELTENQLEKVEAIQEASDTLMEIINELFEYSRLSEGIEVIGQRDFNFPNIIQNIEYICNTLITNPDVSFEIKVEPGIPKILKGDPGKLSQILINLLGNSIEFVEKRKIKLQITQKRQRKDKLVLAFRLSDTGMDMARGKLDRTSETHSQVSNDNFLKYGGSGLGFIIVEQTIELLGGNIEVSSISGKGTIFYFEIPYEKGTKANTDQEHANTIMPPNAAKHIKGMHIAVFGDNKIIEPHLLKWGCKVFVTDNVFQGLEYISGNKVDMILMDLMTLGMDGYEITKRIRSNSDKNINQIPVIAAISTGFTLNERKKGKAIGISDFIFKPFSDPQELLLKLIIHGNKTKSPKTISASKTKDTEMQGPEHPKVRLDTVLEECAGDYGFLKEKVRIFKRGALEFIGAYSVHMKNADWDKLSFAVLKIKPMIALLHADSLMVILERLQAILQLPTASNSKEMHGAGISFIEEYERVSRTIDLEMGKLGS